MKNLILFFAFFTFSASADFVNGLYYNTFGDPRNPHILYVHGGPGYNSFSFERSAAEDVAKQGFYVGVYDQRGSGRSQTPMPQDWYTLENYTQDLLTVIKAAGMEKPLLLGHSFGGTVALNTLKNHPDLVGKVVMMDSPVSWKQMVFSTIQSTTIAFVNQGNTQAAQSSRELSGRIFPYGRTGPARFTATNIGEVFANAMNSGIYSPAQTTIELEEVRKQLQLYQDSWLLHKFELGPLNGLIENENLYNLKLWSILKNFKGRIHAIYGSEDQLFDHYQLNAIEREVGGSRYNVIFGAAHSPFIDQKAEFIKVMKRILRPGQIVAPPQPKVEEIPQRSPTLLPWGVRNALGTCLPYLNLK